MDTPEYIKKKQLAIWLSKSPAERLRQFLTDNDTLMLFWKKMKNEIKKTPTQQVNKNENK